MDTSTQPVKSWIFWHLFDIYANWISFNIYSVLKTTKYSIEFYRIKMKSIIWNITLYNRNCLHLTSSITNRQNVGLLKRRWTRVTMTHLLLHVHPIWKEKCTYELLGDKKRSFQQKNYRLGSWTKCSLPNPMTKLLPSTKGVQAIA